jgi:N-acetyl-1-D-myo-inositol-2-amino-2-deoxy-alpha-D-glucopyranoside deacetylase
MRAFELAARPDFRRDLGEAWQVVKVYWNAIADSSIRQAILALREAGDMTTFEGIDPDGDIPYAVADDLVTTEIDGADYAEAKVAAARARDTDQGRWAVLRFVEQSR